MRSPQEAKIDSIKVDFSKPPYDQPEYKFPYGALAATVSAVAFAALYKFSYLLCALAGPIGLVGFALSVVVGYNLYQNNRGEAEFEFAKSLETAGFVQLHSTHQAIFWLKKAALRHYSDAASKAESFQTAVNTKKTKRSS